MHCGDCLDILKDYPSDYFDLICTSPPYADSRKRTYGGIKPDQYAEWFLPRSEQFLRVLKPSGTFILNIKEKVVNKERSTYVIELIPQLRQQGWVWTEEFIWHKKSCVPGKWPNRFRDAWERCLQFNKTKQFKMRQENVMVPICDSTKSRLNRLGRNDRTRQSSQTQSGFGRNISKWVGREMVYPTNVLHMSPETRNRSHSAVFPEALPRWFIQLFTDPDDWVLDAFSGSGTSCGVAKTLGRNSVGIDKIPEYVELAKERINKG